MLKQISSLINKTHHSESEGEGVEIDRPKSALIAKMGIALVITLAVMWYAFQALMWYASTHIEAGQQAKHDAVILESREAKKQLLNNYDIVDKEKGYYRIPIRDAMDKLVRQGTVDIK